LIGEEFMKTKSPFNSFKSIEQIRTEFKTLKKYFDLIKSNYYRFTPYFKEISMGMSGDYQIAIEEGSTMVRIGSLIFGGRS
jgi:hypothetical protein